MDGDNHLDSQKGTQVEPNAMEEHVQVHIDWQQIDTIIDKYSSDHEALLMIMQDISDIYNYVPPEVVPVLEHRLGVKKSLI